MLECILPAVWFLKPFRTWFDNVILVTKHGKPPGNAAFLMQ